MSLTDAMNKEAVAHVAAVVDERMRVTRLRFELALWVRGRKELPLADVGVKILELDHLLQGLNL